MKKMDTLKLFVGIFLILNVFAARAQEDGVFNQNDSEVEIEEKQELLRDAEEAVQVFSETSEELENLIETSAGYAVFPNVGKGAWILGGASGNGILYENGKLQGYAEMRQIDIGFQFGGQAYREIIFFKTQDALERFKQGDFSFEGAASAVILEKGKAKGIKFENGVGVAIMPKAGAMIGISVAGQDFDYRDAEME